MQVRGVVFTGGLWSMATLVQSTGSWESAVATVFIFPLQRPQVVTFQKFLDRERKLQRFVCVHTEHLLTLEAMQLFSYVDWGKWFTGHIVPATQISRHKINVLVSVLTKWSEIISGSTAKWGRSTPFHWFCPQVNFLVLLQSFSSPPIRNFFFCKDSL